MVVIIDYKMGNLGSIKNMLKKIGVSAVISSEAIDIEKAERLILPGVGAFEGGIRNIGQLGLLPILYEKVIKRKTPLLGICLGMQLLTKRSEEGKLSGLGWIEGETVRFSFDPKQTGLRIPHMGWNNVNILRRDSLFKESEDDARFYFVHSYHVICDRREDVLSVTNHGYDFVSSFQKENIMGVQFHPEKSHKFGLKLLKNFVELN